MGSVRAWFRSRHGRAFVASLALASACGRSDVDPGECREPEVDACVRSNGKPGVRQCFDGRWSECGRGSLPAAGAGGGGAGGSGSGTGGSGGLSSGGDAGRGGRPLEPMGGASTGGLAGLAGEGPGGDDGSGGDRNASLYCEDDEQAVLYLLSREGVLYRLDADTLQTLTQVDLAIGGLNSLAATHDGQVFVTSGLQLYRVDTLTGKATNVGLDASGLVGLRSLTIGYAPVDPVVSGECLLLAHLDFDLEADLYAVPLSTFVPMRRHHFDDMHDYPEPLAAPNQRTFAMIHQGFVEYDPITYAKLGELEVPGLDDDWSGDSAYLSGYLFAIYDQGEHSHVYRVQVEPRLEDSPSSQLGTVPFVVIGAGAACERAP